MGGSLVLDEYGKLCGRKIAGNGRRMYSLGHSLGDYNQSRKRVDRPGQTREGVYIHLIAKRTIDSTVMTALEKKEEIVESVLRQYRERT